MFFAFIYVKSDESTQNPGRRPLHHHEKRIHSFRHIASTAYPAIAGNHRCDTECNAHCQGILFFLSFVLQIGFRGCFLPETAPRQSAGYPDPRFPLSPSFVPSDRFGSFAPTGRTLPRKPRRGLEQSLKALYHSIFISFASIRGTRETRL